jgi:Winged helix DNA-binding domain
MPPYHALFSRLEGFDPHELGRMISEREVVRLTLMRGTVHLVTVRDALMLRPLVQNVIERGWGGNFRRRIAGVDLELLSRATREIVDAAPAPLTGREIARRLIDRGAGDDLEAIGTAVRVYAPLVQVPPRGVWGKSGQARYATLEAWTGRELGPEPSADDVVLRYLRAFGPASVMDVQTWSGLTKLRPVLERLRPQLVTFRAHDGTELFDLPDAPRPDADTPAPPRLLGQFDNALLSHAERSRIVPAQMTPWMDPASGSRHVNNLLVDGMLRGTWWLEREGALVIRTITPLRRAERAETEAEAERMLAFVAPESSAGEVRFETS